MKSDKYLKDRIEGSMGERIYKLRRSAGLTQSELGEAIGVNASAVAHWERNHKSVHAVNIIALCSFFGVSADWLLGLKD